MLDSAEFEDAVSISLGAGIVSFLIVLLLNSYPTGLAELLALLQGSIVAIAIAIYTLSNQLAADVFSVRVLDTLPSNNEVDSFLQLFGISLFADIAALLIQPTVTGNGPTSAFVVFIVMSLFAGTLTSLYYLKDNIIRQALPSEIADRVGDILDTDAVLAEIETRDRPFFQLFESIRAPIREGDQQTAIELTDAAASSIRDSLVNLYDSGISHHQKVRSISVALSNTLNSALDMEQYVLSIKIHKWMLTCSLDSVQSRHQAFAHHGIPSLSPALNSLSTQRSQRLLREVDWSQYDEIFTQACRLDDSYSVYYLTEIVAGVAQEIEDHEFDLHRRTAARILQRLLESFFKGWASYLNTNSRLPQQHQIMMGDPTYIDITEPMEFQFNEFVEKLNSILMAISTTSRTTVGAMDFHGVGREITDGLLMISGETQRRHRFYLTIFLIKLAVICSQSIGNPVSSKSLASKLIETHRDGPRPQWVIQIACHELSTGDKVEFFKVNGMVMDIASLAFHGGRDTDEVLDEFTDFMAELQEAIKVQSQSSGWSN